jgi:hypothetical protein
MAASPAPALPPDPDNAALLYYQGFLSMPQFSEEARDRLEDAARGKITPDDKVREDIAQSKGAIHFAEAGVKVPTCQWGMQLSEGFDALMPQFAQIRLMTYVLLADARVRAADGDYRGAFERCLMTVNFARHTGDDTLISYLVSLSERRIAYQCMQDVVGQAAGDAELLQWLKNELAKSQINTISAVRPLKFEIEIFTDLVQMKNIEKVARILADSNEKKTAEIISKANAEILQKARQMYTERMDSAIKVWNTRMPYEQAHSQLKKLENDIDMNDPASASVRAFIPTITRVLTLKTRSEAHVNAIKAGIEVLLSRARTGRLADTLPAGLPKDAFSGKDFEYEKTKDGFILRCQGRDLDKDEINQYEFKLSK